MNDTKVNPVEEERQELLREITEDSGADGLEAFKPGSAGCHELLDRTMLVSNLLERYIRSHPACVQESAWFGLASQALDLLLELYQRVGEKHLNEPTTEPKEQSATALKN